MNAIGAIILLVALTIVVCAPRRWALIGWMAGVMFLTQGQQLDVFGFNMYGVRFVELAGFIRVLARGEFSFSRLRSIDRALLLLYVYTTVVFLLRSSEGGIFAIGVMTDAFLCYFAFRGLVGDVEEFRWFLRAFLLLLAPFAALVMIESITTHNPFAVMGAVKVEDFMRAGRLRCQGSFRHPILMGTLGAAFLPLYIALLVQKRDRATGVIGVALCLTLVWAANSGGPVSCAGIAVLGWGLWYWRKKMLKVRKAIVWGIIALTLVMKAPVWYLLARASAVTGGGGWHRSYLIDMAFQHLGRWWFAGMPIKETVDWFPYSLAITGGADMTNAFISFGIAAGIGGLGLFIALLVCAYRRLGLALSAVRESSPEASSTEFLLWGLGVTLAVHIVNWLGITYFDQIYVVWFMQLAAICNMTEASLRAAESRLATRVEAERVFAEEQPLAWVAKEPSLSRSWAGSRR